MVCFPSLESTNVPATLPTQRPLLGLHPCLSLGQWGFDAFELNQLKMLICSLIDINPWRTVTGSIIVHDSILKATRELDLFASRITKSIWTVEGDNSVP